MTELKAIKISKETYAELSAIAGELQVKLKRHVSIEEAMKHLIKRRKKGKKISYPNVSLLNKQVIEKRKSIG